MSTNIVPASREAIARAADLLRAGELVAFPTETVYGLGADALSDDAVRRIFTAKARPADHPVIVHLPDAASIDAWVTVVPEGARKLAAAFWPGPLTLVLPRAAHVSDAITGGQDNVGLRVPSHQVVLALLAEFARRGGRGIAAPSANRFGHVSPTTAQHVAADLGDKVALILDGGACQVGIESTIVAFGDGTPAVLRPGGIGIDELERVLGARPRHADATLPRASGTLVSHYAPHTRARLVHIDTIRAEIAQYEDRDETVAVLARTLDKPAGFGGAWTRAPNDPAGYAHDLYANLRALDATGADELLIEEVPDAPAWEAVRDRLARATHGDADDRD